MSVQGMSLVPNEGAKLTLADKRHRKTDGGVWKLASETHARTRRKA